MTLGPSIYPLAFAAIGGRCMRSIAVFVAERGTTILVQASLPTLRAPSNSKADTGNITGQPESGICDWHRWHSALC